MARAWTRLRTLKSGAVVAHIQWRGVDGRLRQRSLGTADPHVAEMERRLTEQQLEAGAPARVTDDAQEALRRFEIHARLSCSEDTVDFYMEKLRRIVAHFGDLPMRQWTRAGFEALVAKHTAPVKKGDKQRRKPWGPGSIKKHVASAQRFIAWARDADVVCPDFIGRFKGPKLYQAAPRVITREQLDALLDAAKGDPREPAIALAGLAGLRRREFLRLDPSRVDWQAGRICVPGRKVHKDRWVDLCPKLRDVLERHRPVAGPFVRFDPDAFGAYTDFHELCARAGVPPCGWHTLRHTFGTLLLDGGAQLHNVRDLLGHSNIGTTSRYVHSSAAGRRADMKRVFG